MRTHSHWLTTELERRGVSRREFMGFCATMAAALALPEEAAARIAQCGPRDQKPAVWLEFQDCAGNTESFLRASRPTSSRDRCSTSCRSTTTRRSWRPPGTRRSRTREARVKERAGEYIMIIEGSDSDRRPTAATARSAGARPWRSRERSCGSGAATIAIGTCAAFGGIPAAAPNPTGALGGGDAVPGVNNLVNLSACPANPENLTALLVYYLTFKTWPSLDHFRRPLFAYGKRFMTTASAAPTSTPASTLKSGGTTNIARASACTRWGARGRSTFQNCPTLR